MNKNEKTSLAKNYYYYENQVLDLCHYFYIYLA